MAHDFIPRRDGLFLQWSANFSQRINATPGSYSLTPAQAAEYAALHDAYAAAYRRARTPDTNSTAAVIAKNNARAALERRARQLARIVQSADGVTDDQHGELGLTIRRKASPVPAPAERPDLDILRVDGSQVRVRVQENSERPKRGKPDGVAGATLLYFVGDQPPADISRWRFGGNITRTIADVQIPDDVPPGTPVWLCSCWYNTRAQAGPLSYPKQTYLMGGVRMKLAA